LFTVAVGSGLTVTVPEADALTHVVVVLVIITEYIPATVVLNEATLPGFVTPAGTVHANEYVAGVPGVAVTVAGVPAHTDGLFTVTVGNGFTVTVPEADVLTQFVAVFVIITE
jgi:hypothetical protein